MNLLLDETAEAGQSADVETEGVSAEGLEGVVKGGEAKEADVDLLHVRERDRQLRLGLRGDREGHVLEDDGGMLLLATPLLTRTSRTIFALILVSSWRLVWSSSVWSTSLFFLFFLFLFSSLRVPFFFLPWPSIKA